MQKNNRYKNISNSQFIIGLGVNPISGLKDSDLVFEYQYLLKKNNFLV